MDHHEKAGEVPGNAEQSGTSSGTRNLSANVSAVTDAHVHQISSAQVSPDNKDQADGSFKEPENANTKENLPIALKGSMSSSPAQRDSGICSEGERQPGELAVLHISHPNGNTSGSLINVERAAGSSRHDHALHVKDGGASHGQNLGTTSHLDNKKASSPTVCTSIRLKRWTPEEDACLKRLYAELGSCWSEIKKRLPHRTAASLRSRWLKLISHGGIRKPAKNSPVNAATGAKAGALTNTLAATCRPGQREVLSQSGLVGVSIRQSRASLLPEVNGGNRVADRKDKAAHGPGSNERRLLDSQSVIGTRQSHSTCDTDNQTPVERTPVESVGQVSPLMPSEMSKLHQVHAPSSEAATQAGKDILLPRGPSHTAKAYAKGSVAQVESAVRGFDMVYKHCKESTSDELDILRRENIALRWALLRSARVSSEGEAFHLSSNPSAHLEEVHIEQANRILDSALCVQLAVAWSASGKQCLPQKMMISDCDLDVLRRHDAEPWSLKILLKCLVDTICRHRGDEAPTIDAVNVISTAVNDGLLNVLSKLSKHGCDMQSICGVVCRAVRELYVSVLRGTALEWALIITTKIVAPLLEWSATQGEKLRVHLLQYMRTGYLDVLRACLSALEGNWEDSARATELCLAVCQGSGDVRDYLTGNLLESLQNRSPLFALYHASTLQQSRDLQSESGRLPASHGHFRPADILVDPPAPAPGDQAVKRMRTT